MFPSDEKQRFLKLLHFSYNLSQEDAQTYIVLQKALRRISSIVSSLKKVSRNEGNASFIPSDAREALEETLALFAPYLKDNDILKVGNKTLRFISVPHLQILSV